MHKMMCCFWMASESEGRIYTGLENCEPDADWALSSAQNLRDLPDFWSSRIWSCKNKKLIDLQVFSRIGKKIK